jgi:hypothetical protein
MLKSVKFSHPLTIVCLSWPFVAVVQMVANG